VQISDILSIWFSHALYHYDPHNHSHGIKVLDVSNPTLENPWAYSWGDTCMTLACPHMFKVFTFGRR
jgi:hypothetical protein